MLFAKKRKFLFFVLLLFCILGANFVYALETNYPSFPGIPAPTDNSALSDYIAYFFKLSMVVLGILFILSLVIGGVRYLLSTGKPDMMISAKNQISYAFFGILILLSSWILLNTLNPQLTVLEISSPEPVEELEFPETSPYPFEEFRSSINTEIPFGKIIEQKVLETKDTMPEQERNQRKSRMDRIKDIGENSLTLAEKIIKVDDQSNKTSGFAEDLKKLSEQCSCFQADPCCENPNPGTGCKDNSCTTKPGCTCDPCEDERKDIRRQIQEKENENLKIMYKGAEIQQKNARGQNTKITTSLRQEQEKADKEIRQIKEEIGKLERAEMFMLQCPLRSLSSLTDLLDTMNYYSERNWWVKFTKIWEDIIVYDDWATFYCPVSGTLWESDQPITSEMSETEAFVPDTGFLGEDPVPCTIEIPVGEMIDRTKRTGYKLIERLEKIIDLNEQLIKATDELHTLISQCSSQGPSSNPERSGCRSICYKTSSGVCIKYCAGNPCPTAAIEKKIQEIKNIVEGIPNKPAEENKKKEKEGIRDVVKGKKKTSDEAIEDEKTREQIGITTIIDEIVPEILKELDVTNRKNLKRCTPSFMGVSGVFNCSRLKNDGIAPDGELIKECCYQEEWFNECLYQCYLEAGALKQGLSGQKEIDALRQGETKYKKCLKKCLDDKAKENNIEAMADCRHYINFFCCTFE